MSRIVQWLLCAAALLTCPSLTFAQEPAEQPEIPNRLPLATPNYEPAYQPQVLTIPQQRAKFAADQRMLRMQWNAWIGYSPLRPNMNASYMSQRSPRYYVPSRGMIVSTGARAWYW